MLKLALAGVGAFLFLTSPVYAGERSTESDRFEFSRQNTAEILQVQHLSTSDSIELAQLLNTRCPPNTSLYRAAETRNYFAHICAAKGGTLVYIGGAKKGAGNSVNVTIPSNSSGQFVAVQGNTRYILTQSQLRIIQDNKIIVNERVLRWTQ
ncbi:hypothetical protein [Coleofasciculus sp. FACHB-1120]|uniref:hypothetical protein n=1 Tax=Coleofasciculus sp. FACHB-1120 TaxID=2692783 RepID=UPI001684FED4|nr:hypothetical protein [Coleofasciculus sp. FACHB-1120]MBD2743950.1 hypothetical protein [Coleofasciculus sp. FACHB-1120]